MCCPGYYLKPPSTDRALHHYCHFNHTMPGRWIGREMSIIWPPRSPDLTQLIVFLCGYVKNLVYPIKILSLAADSPHKVRCGYRNSQYASEHVERRWISFGYLSCHQDFPLWKLLMLVLARKESSEFFSLRVPTGCVYNRKILRYHLFFLDNYHSDTLYFALWTFLILLYVSFKIQYVLNRVHYICGVSEYLVAQLATISLCSLRFW